MPDANLVAPRKAKSIDELVKPGMVPRRRSKSLVLWLDDLEQFVRVGARGMRYTVLNELGKRRYPVTILATAGGKGLQVAGKPTRFSGPLADLMPHAREIRLKSELSDAERRRLTDYAPAAAKQIAREGIGEYMIAGKELEHKLFSGEHRRGDLKSLHGQAVAYTVVDWHRCGIIDPIPRALLREAYEEYLPESADPSDEAFAKGLKWAREPLYSSVALISGRDEFRAYDHIVSYVERDLGNEIKRGAWQHFQRAASDEHAFDLANTAYKLSEGDPASPWTELAEQAIRQAAGSDDPDLVASANFNLSVLLQERDDKEGTEEALHRAEEAGHGGASMQLARIYSERDDEAAERDSLRRAEEAGYPEAPLNLGVLLRKQGKMREAMDAFRRAEEAGNENAPAYIGILLEEEGDWRSAEAAYRRAEEAGNAGAALNLGLLLKARKRPDEAEAAFRRAEAGGYPDAALNLGLLQWERENLSEAERSLRRAEKAGNTDAGIALAHLLDRSGREEEALATFRRAAEAGNFTAAMKLGGMLSALGREEEAEDAFRLAKEIGEGEREDDPRASQRDRQGLLHCPIERVADLEASQVGVAPETPEALEAIGHGDGSDYLSLDVDDLLDESLAEAREADATQIIVVSGPSRAGKTRALFEAAKRQMPEAYLVAPVDAEAIHDLTTVSFPEELHGEEAILWLDDLERYVNAEIGGMRPYVLENMDALDCRFVVLATAGGKGLRWMGDDDLARRESLEEILAVATEIDLSLELSPEEVGRLEEFAPAAADQIARQGIGEFMVATDDLEEKLRTGCHRPGAPFSPHGQSIAFAAIDWRRAGISTPMPKTVLRDAYESYLPEEAAPSDEGFEEGLEWAREPLYATVALLSGEDELEVDDHLVEFVDAALDREINGDAWLCFLEASSDRQALELASVAMAHGILTEEEEWVTRAERALRRAMQSDASEIAGMACTNLGSLLQQRGDLKEAEAVLRRADELGVAGGSVNLGNLLIADKRTEEAEAAFRRADELEEAAGSLNLGTLLWNLKRFDEAEAAFRRADERGHGEALARLGGMLIQRGESERGMAILREASEKGSAEAAYMLGLLHEDEEDDEQAMAAFYRADELGHPEAALTVGSRLFEDGKKAKALEAFRRAAERGEAKGAYNVGAILLENGKWDEAEAAFEVAQELGHPKAAEALDRLRDDAGD